MTSPDILLAIWFSPSFPVGAFAYSHGLEWAVETGDVRDAATLADWLGDLLRAGGARNDCILFAQGWRAARAADQDGLRAVNELALALAPSAERRLETTQQGGSFLDAIVASWPHPLVEACAPALQPQPAWPVAVALASAAHEIPLRRACESFALAFVANLVSAAVRLGPIGQTQGQQTLRALSADVAALGAMAAQSNLDDLGGACVMADIASMRHETQYSRLFRS
ncbi:MAG: urease accessory protein UreF [Hyphomicrobiales bacterium]|nr:urease accessory protein UreF [Hyphomicrobiales bacterium]